MRILEQSYASITPGNSAGLLITYPVNGQTGCKNNTQSSTISGLYFEMRYTGNNIWRTQVINQCNVYNSETGELIENCPVGTTFNISLNTGYGVMAIE